MMILDLHDIYCRDGNGGFFVDEDKARKVFSQFDNTREIFVKSSVLPIGARIIPEEAFLKADEPFIYKHYEYITLDSEVFRNNINIEFVVLDENISEIGEYAFSNCINLKEIVLPDTQILINAFAFENCKSLKSIFLPDTTNYIHTGTFKNCTSLEYLYVPEGCMGIDDNVFENCTSLKKIFLPKSLSYIGKYAFLGCVNLEEISGGENIYPVQIEDFIRTNEKVHDVAVIGLKDKRLGEVAAAVIELKEGVTMTKEEMDEYCMRLPRYKRPHEIIFADIPRNPTGKIEKPKLRELYGASRLIADQNLS